MPEPLNRVISEFDRRAAALEFFDACAWVGRPPEALRAFVTGAALHAALRRWGISRALVSHTMSVQWDAARGNEALAKELLDLPGCFGAMALLPPAGGELGDFRAHLDQMLARGMRAARLFPKVHRFSLRDPSLEAVFAELAARGVPLLMWIGQSSWDELAALAGAHPALRIVVDGVGHHEYLNCRQHLAQLDRHPNLLVEIHNLLMFRGIETIVERIGAERVLFGTNLPETDPAAAMMLLTHSELSEHQRRLIAGENLARLIEGVKV